MYIYAYINKDLWTSDVIPLPPFYRQKKLYPSLPSYAHEHKMCTYLNESECSQILNFFFKLINKILKKGCIQIKIVTI